MKQELTIEEKEKVYAMYWGQEILNLPHLVYTGNPPEPSHDEWGYEPVGMTSIRKVVENEFPLELTPLSRISDEDAIEVAKIAYQHLEVSYTDETNMYDGRYIVNNHIKLDTNYSLHQYLISKGYAVPLFFAQNHWANGNTAIELGIAIETPSPKPN